MPIDETWQALIQRDEFKALSDEEQQRLMALAASRDPDFAAMSPEHRQQLLQRVAPDINIMSLLRPSRQEYNPGEQFGEGTKKAVGALVKYGIPTAATIAAGPLAQMAGASIKAIPLIQALTQAGANAAVGNTELAKLGTLPGLGGALGQAMLPPSAGLLKQGAAEGIGSLLGYGANVAAGLEDTDPLQAGIAAGAPIALGAGVAGAKRAVRAGARLLPGMEIALGEKALKDADTFWEDLRPKQQSKDLYEALSKQGKAGPGIPLPNTVGLRKQLYSEQGVDEDFFAGSTTPVMARASSRTAIDEQVNAITTGKAKYKKLETDLRDRLLTVEKKELAYNRALQSKDVLAISFAEEELGIAQARAEIAEATYDAVQDEVRAATGQVKKLFDPTREAPFAVVHRQLKQLSHRIQAAAAGGGEDLGILKKSYGKLWNDIEASGAYSKQLREANNAFITELAAERIGEMTTQSIGPLQRGVPVIDANNLAAKIIRAFREDELFSRAYSDTQRRGILKFYSDLAYETSKENRIGLVVATSMVGGMAGQGIGIGWPAGSLIGVTAPNYLTRIAARSPKVRQLLLDMVAKENGRISYEALGALAQLADQEHARYRSVEYSVVEEEER